MERACALPNGTRAEPGSCYWRTRAGAPMPMLTNNRDLSDLLHVWDPESAGAPGYRRLGVEEARTCMRGKRLLMMGDSTTRDTFYELAAVAAELEAARSGAADGAWALATWAPAGFADAVGGF